MKKINFDKNYSFSHLKFIQVYKNTSKLVSNTTELIAIEALNSLEAINKDYNGLFHIDKQMFKNLLDITGISARPQLTDVLKKLAEKGLIELAIGNADGYEAKGGRMVFARSLVAGTRSGLFFQIDWDREKPQEPCETKSKDTYEKRMAEYRRDLIKYGLNGIKLCTYLITHTKSIKLNQTNNNKKGTEKVYDHIAGIAELESWLPEERRAISRAVSYLEDVNMIWVNKVNVTACYHQKNITAAPISSFTRANLEKNGKLEAVNKAIASSVSGKIQTKRLKTIQSHINKTVENINKAVTKLTAKSKPYSQVEDTTYFDIEEAILGNDNSNKLAKDFGNILATDKNITAKRIAKINGTYNITTDGILGMLLFGNDATSFFKVEMIDEYDSIRKEKLKAVIHALYVNLNDEEAAILEADIENLNNINGTNFSVIGWLHGEVNYNIA